MKTIIQNLLIAIGIVAIVLIIGTMTAYVAQSVTRDEIRNQKFDDCMKVAEQNNLGQEFIKTCMN